MIVVVDSNAAIEVVLKREKGILFRQLIESADKTITSEFFKIEVANVIRKRHDKLLGNPMKHLDYIAQPAWDKHIEYMKSKVRCKVEHAFAIIKNKFGYRKAVCRGLEKNKARLYMLFCSANLLRLSWSLA
jgi:uncharacterized protein with PIN domain